MMIDVESLLKPSNATDNNILLLFSPKYSVITTICGNFVVLNDIHNKNTYV